MLIEIITNCFDYPAYVTLCNGKYYLMIGNSKPEYLCDVTDDYKMILSQMVY